MHQVLQGGSLGKSRQISSNKMVGEVNFSGIQCDEEFFLVSAFTRPIGLRDSIFKVTIESAAVLKH